MSDGSNKPPTVGPSVFMPQKHPELRQLGSKAIQTFLQQREQYLLKAEDAVAQGSSYQPVSLVNSVDYKLLEALVAFDTFRNVNTVTELTDDLLLPWLKSQIEDSTIVITPEELETLVKENVRIKMKEPDTKIRLMSLFMDYYTFLAERNLRHIIDNNTKVAVKHICALIKPAGLRQKIENNLALEKADLKKNWKAFYAYVIENAVMFESFFASVVQTGDDSSTPRDQDDDGSKRSPRKGARGRYQRGGRRKPSGEGPAPTDNSAPEGDNDPPQDNQPGKKRDAPPPTNAQIPFCLSKETCPGERHFMRDCPKASEEKKRELLAEFRRKRRQPPPAIKRIRTVEVENEDDEDRRNIPNTNGRITAMLADSVPVVVSGDYGSDHAAMSEEHLAKLAAANVFVPVLPLQNPVSMQLAVDGSDDRLTITAHRKARISTTLSTLEGPFRLRNVEYLVFKESMPEVLLSRPLLQSLGFNLDQHLARVRARFQDADCSSIGFDPNPQPETSALPEGSLSRLLSAELPHAATYLDDSDDHPREDVTQQTQNTTQAPDKDDFLDVGRHTIAEVTPHLERMSNEALDNGLPPTLAPRLRQMLDEYQDVFRVKLGSDPPAQVPPMHIRLEPGAKPVRVKLRRYSQPQQEFLRNKVLELQRLGLVKRNTQSSWACAPLIIPKPGPESFRFTTDLRPVNKVTIPHVWPMPNLETVVTRLANQKCFASIDLCHGYWQFPLAEDSQECQSFITPDGVYTPTRVMHGQRNAVSYCQTALQTTCEALLHKLLFWLDDILIHDEDPSEFLDTIEALFKLCVEYNLKLHAAKCHLFLTEVRWCGRLVNSQGVRMHPARLDALLDMPFPSTADQLQQFVCAANWMRAGIPQFTTIIAPLAELLEEIYSEIGSRTKRRVSKVKLTDAGWDTQHETAFENVKQALANSVVLAHPDSNRLFCLFTDASEKRWSGTLTQIPPADLDLQFQDQGHQPLAFIPGSFTGSSSRWSTPEKEAAAIINSIRRLDYLLMRPEGFHLFTDHSNLVFLFNPETAAVHLNKGSVSKVQRWSMILAQYQYTIIHISGDDNCWADLLSRWAAAPPTGAEISKKKAHLRLAALLVAPLTPAYDPEFTWPSRDDFIAAQRAVTAADKEEFKLVDQEGILKLPSGTVFVPRGDVHLQLRICVIAHCGRGGHRAFNSTYSAVKDFCFWKTMQKDIAT